jgi:hypothetical protein
MEPYFFDAGRPLLTPRASGTAESTDYLALRMPVFNILPLLSYALIG